MKCRSVYVIMDEDGKNYVAPGQTEHGWYYNTYTGIATGFKCYSNKKIAEHRIMVLGRKFQLKCVNFYLILDGERIKESSMFIIQK